MTEKNEKKLKRLFALMDDDTLTREEFVKQFENVVKIIEDLRKENGSFVDNLKKTYGNATDALKKGSEKGFTDYKKEVQKVLSDLLGTINSKLADVKNGEPGKDADEEVIVGKVIKRIKFPKPEEVILDDAGQIRDKLESLEGEERLDISAIKGIEKLEKNDKGEVKIIHGPLGMQLYIDGVKKGWIKTINLKAGTSMAIAHSKVNGLDTLTFNASGGSGSGVTVETPPEPPNQITTVFTVSAEPKFVVADGTTYFAGAGYSYSALAVTMDVAPSASIRVVI